MKSCAKWPINLNREADVIVTLFGSGTAGSGLTLLTGLLSASTMEQTRQSLAATYQVPEWFQDGKIGVWMHWGISSAVDKTRPNDGSWYGRNMYGGGKALAKTLFEWHTKRYGPPSEFGYEKLIPLFKADNWAPNALVKFVKENGARFIILVACHQDNFDMYDSSHPWNSVQMGPHRDTLREWKTTATHSGLKFGVSTHLYWSPGWFSPALPTKPDPTCVNSNRNAAYQSGNQEETEEHFNKANHTLYYIGQIVS